MKLALKSIEGISCNICHGEGWYTQQTGHNEQEQRQCEECGATGINTDAGSKSLTITCDRERLAKVLLLGHRDPQSIKVAFAIVDDIIKSQEQWLRVEYCPAETEKGK